MAMSVRALGVTLLPLLAACGSVPTTLLTLDAIAPPAAAIRADYRGPPIRVPAVHVPAMLDRVEFVDQFAAGEAKTDDFAHWAAPLGMLARDALVRDLTARLPAGAVLPPGMTGNAKGAAVIDVTILSFDARANQTSMQVAYRMLPDGGLHQSFFQIASSGRDPASAARAFAALLGRLADKIVATAPNAR